MTEEPAMPGVRVDIPVVPEMAEVFGFRGDARYVGIYQLEYSDDISITDGVNTGSGNTWVFQSYRRHPAVAPLLREARLGSLDEDASQMLLIDREGGRASLAPIAGARAFLKRQWPPEPPLSEEQREAISREMDKLLQGGWREEKVDMEQVRRAMEEQRGRVGRMMSFLEMCPVPPQEGRGA